MVKVVFVTNYFNHHQKAFSDAMYRNDKIEFTFIATTTMREERKKLGYIEDDLPDYVICSYISEEKEKQATYLINTADVVIAGSAPEKMLYRRIRHGKLTLRYSERPLKQDVSKLEYWKLWVKWHIKNPYNKPIYLLCASAYAYSDYQKFGLFMDKAYKWGYFPETKYYSDINDLINQKKKNVILWCGRLLKWKNPQYAIEVANRLKCEKYDFELRIIGSGEEEEDLKSLIEKYELYENIRFLGSMSPERVRFQMEEAGIYLFTSNKQEGWGAVLNEAMNSGCAVVASDSTGSTPYLINTYINGITYPSEDVNSLYKSVKYLLDNTNEQERFGVSAYHTVVNVWNAEVAAERLINLIKNILENNDPLNIYKEGPCSRADLEI